MNLNFKNQIKLNQLHAVSCTQQSRQMERSVKILRSPPVLEALHVEWRNSMPRFAPTPEQRNENINLTNISFPRVGIEPTTNRFYIHTLCPCATTGAL